jgi:hypothetical protein
MLDQNGIDPSTANDENGTSVWDEFRKQRNGSLG